MKRIIVGEGAYGCVHKPSVQCETLPTPNFDYSKYVSKIMKTKNAEKELSEFLIIEKIDPNDEYHLGTPVLCKPNLNDENVVNDIQKCRHIKMDNKNKDLYSLLVLKYGGPDLKALCHKYLENYLKTNKEKKTDKFWLEVHHLLKGLKFFKDNGIVHYDLKPQNILFEPVNGKMKYIDFGLMKTKNQIVETSNNNNNPLSGFHWSYPFEVAFMNKRFYNNYKNSSKQYKDVFKKQLCDMIITDSKMNNMNIPIAHPEAFKIIFTYLNLRNEIPDATTQYSYINAFFNGFNELIEKESYDTVLDHIINSIDVFGLGFSLQYMANCFRRLGALTDEEYIQLSSLFHKMYDFNPITRETNLDYLINEYENILMRNGVLTRLNVSFKDNKLVKKFVAPVSIIKAIEKPEKSPKHLSKELQEIANKDPVSFSKKCKDNKELNPLTNRCVNKCNEGFVRNDKFRCIKNKEKRNEQYNIIKEKHCPDNKEINPKTNRCVNKCREGYERNEKFICIKRKKDLARTMKSKSKTIKPSVTSISKRKSKTVSKSKTIKNKSKSKSETSTLIDEIDNEEIDNKLEKVTKYMKICPSDKDLNPNTNRCVKKCKEGLERNKHFRCTKRIKKNT